MKNLNRLRTSCDFVLLKTKHVKLKISVTKEKILKNELKNKNISLNSLTQELLDDWLSFNRHLKKSDMIIFPKPIIKEIIITHSTDQIKRITEKMAKYYVDFLLLKNNLKEEKPSNILQLLFDKFGYGKLVFKNQEKHVLCELEHDLGLKGSKLFKTLIEQIFLHLFGVSPQIKYT